MWKLLLFVFGVFKHCSSDPLAVLKSISNFNSQNEITNFKNNLPSSSNLKSLPTDHFLTNYFENTNKINSIKNECEKYGFTIGPNIGTNGYLNDTEMSQRMGYQQHPKSQRIRRSNRAERDVNDIPQTVYIDYQNCLGPCEDQGLCACCYAHASTAAISYFLYTLYKSIYILSVQQFIDCSPRPDEPSLSNAGCDYGHYEECAIYLQNHPGVNLNEDYPFIEAEQTCRDVEEKKLLKNYNVKYVYCKDEDEAFLALQQGYLVLAAICAKDAFRFYKGGILNGPMGCEPCEANHAVVITGLKYSSIWKMWFWIGRNSWGTEWGDNGYFRMRAFNNCASIGTDLAYFKFTPK